jgi:hypothetical protein
MRRVIDALNAPDTLCEANTAIRQLASIRKVSSMGILLTSTCVDGYVARC